MRITVLLLSLLFSFHLRAQNAVITGHNDSVYLADLHQRLNLFAFNCQQTAQKMLASGNLDSIRNFAAFIRDESGLLIPEVRRFFPQTCETSPTYTYAALGWVFALSTDPDLAALGNLYIATGSLQPTIFCSSDPYFFERLKDINNYATSLSKSRKLTSSWKKTTRLMLECRNFRSGLQKYEKE